MALELLSAYVPWALWLAFATVVYDAFFKHNAPTFSEPGGTDAKRKNHLQRLRTAVFWVPFVAGAAINVPLIFKLFMILVIWKALSEYIEIVAPDRSQMKDEDDKKKYKHVLSSMERVLQLVGALEGFAACFGFRWFTAASMGLFYLFNSLFIMDLVRGNHSLTRDRLYLAAVYNLGLLLVAYSLGHGILYYTLDEYGGALLAVMLLTSWLGDGAAYYFGSKFGRRKAMPNISPNKSWEGVVAEIVFSVLLCLFFYYLKTNELMSCWPGVAWYHYVVFGLIISILGIFGDAFESVLKRVGRVKDSGVFFTGHGGVLDRFDTFFFVVPSLYYYYHYVVLGNSWNY